MTPRLLSLALLSALAAAPASAGEGAARSDFILHCAGCHGIEGHGTVQGGVPAFQDSVGHIAASDIGRTYLLHVPGVVTAPLSDAEIAEVLNYILDRWGEDGAPFSAAEVTRRRAMPVPDLIAYRREVARTLAANGIRIADYPWP